jgi:hypothetical protein
MLDGVLTILYWTAAFCAPFGLLAWLAVSPVSVPVKIAVVVALVVGGRAFLRYHRANQLVRYEKERKRYAAYTAAYAKYEALKKSEQKS